MAELSYNDVQRAVQDSLRNLQVSVQRLTSNLGVVSSRSDHIEVIETAIRDLQRTTQLMQANLNTMRVGVGADPRVSQLIHDMYELKLRFVTIERFIQQVGTYIQMKIDEESEEQQFHNT
jgi:hypothetical protein